MQKMIATIRTRYQRANTYCQGLYNRALHTIGVHDCAEMRITTAVAVCVAIWYLLCILHALADALACAAHTITTIVHS